MQKANLTKIDSCIKVDRLKHGSVETSIFSSASAPCLVKYIKVTLSSDLELPHFEIVEGLS